MDACHSHALDRTCDKACVTFTWALVAVANWMEPKTKPV